MASSRPSQHRLDVMDVSVAWAAFEEINQIDVRIALGMVQRGKGRELQLTAIAYSNKPEDTGQPLLVLASASSWVLDVLNLEAAVFRLLYTLDGLIARAEFEGTRNKRAEPPRHLK